MLAELRLVWPDAWKPGCHCAGPRLTGQERHFRVTLTRSGRGRLCPDAPSPATVVAGGAPAALAEAEQMRRLNFNFLVTNFLLCNLSWYGLCSRSENCRLLQLPPLCSFYRISLFLFFGNPCSIFLFSFITAPTYGDMGTTAPWTL